MWSLLRLFANMPLAARSGSEDEVESMDTSDTQWFWFYQAGCGGWHRVEDDQIIVMSSAELESNYLRNPHGIINITAAVGHFQINFAESMQVNVTTGQTWKIIRSQQIENGCRCNHDSISPPPSEYWVNVDPKQPYQAFNVGKDTSEYQEIERFVKDVGLLQDPIVSICRIQNMDLWELFCRKKIQLMRLKGQSDIEERRLFHGTSVDNLHSICTFNFNCRLSDKKRGAHVHGKGTYFAKHASYAATYSKSNGQGTKIMLLSRVIVGKYKTGQWDYCTPNDDQDEYIHDSCVDCTLYPKVFVIFDSNQIYPEYVLEFQCN